MTYNSVKSFRVTLTKSYGYTHHLPHVPTDHINDLVSQPKHKSDCFSHFDFGIFKT